MKKNKKIKINIGCGVYFKRGFINVDKFLTAEGMKDGIAKKNPWYANAVWEKGAKFVQADIMKMPFEDNYADYVLMDNVIEHLNIRDVIPAIKEVYRVMKKGATLKIIAPCFDGLARDWIEFAMSAEGSFNQFNYKRFVEVAETFYGNQAGEGEIHRVPINPGFMNFVVSGSGFKEGNIAIIKKYAKISDLMKIGTIVPMNPNSVTRNETLVVTAVK